MTELDPVYMDGPLSLDGVELRLAQTLGYVPDGTLRARGGCRPGGAPTVVAGAGLTIDVTAGQVVIQGAEDAEQGAYLCTNDGTVNKALDAADATDPRLDLVVARLQDAVYSGANRRWQLEVVTGTPAGSPVLPDPAAGGGSWEELYSVAVPANALVPGTITDRRRWTAALGGVLPVRTAADYPASPYAGLMVHRLDTNEVELRTVAGVWRPVLSGNSAAATVWHADMVPGFSGDIDLWRIHRTAYLRVLGSKEGGALSNGNVTNLAYDLDADVSVTIPAGLRPPGLWPGLCTVGNEDATQLQVNTDGTIQLPDVTTPGGGAPVRGTYSWPV